MTIEVTRTEDEILERIKNIDPAEDFFGKRQEVLTYALPFSAAQAAGLIRDDLNEEQLGEAETHWQGPDRVFHAARGYLYFAVEKIAEERGLSASRSVDAFREYLWLLTDDSTEAVYLMVDYEPYGQPQIEYAAEKLGLIDVFIEAAKTTGLHA